MRVAIAATLMLMVGPAWAEDVPQTVADTVPMFCRGDGGDYQPFVRTDFQRFAEAFTRQFGWKHTLHRTSPTIGYLEFSESGDPDKTEEIAYDIEPHDGGLAVLHMHIHLDGKTELISGNKMCWQTFGIVNGK